MKVWGLWYGGGSYAAPEVERDTEEFDSIKQAKAVFEHRAGSDPFYPVVDESTEMWLFFADPRLMDDVYPDRILKIGPRGGVNLEYA
jgi:hypothetical protein